MPIADAAQRSIYQQRTSCVSAPQFYRAYHTSSAAWARAPPRAHRSPASSARTRLRACLKSGLRDTLTVWHDVTSMVGRSCRYNSGQIEHLAAHACAVHWAIHRGPAERTPHRHPQHAQPAAPVRQHHGRRPLLTPMRCPARAPLRHAGQPWGRTRVAKCHHGSRGPRDARPHDSHLFASL